MCRVIIGHLRVTIGHLKATVVHSRVTLGHLKITVFIIFYKQTYDKANTTELHPKERQTCSKINLFCED